MINRPRGRQGRRLRGISLVAGAGLVLASAVLSGCSSSATPATPPTTTTVPVAKNLAVSFLDRYVDPDGRVVRHDQGGDSVSEGQAYGLLLAVAARDAARFDAIWTWEKANLQEPDGLFAYHWSDGAVVGTGAATDADLDTAWALVLAAAAFPPSPVPAGWPGGRRGHPGERDRGQRGATPTRGGALGPHRPVSGGSELPLA